MGTYRRKLKKGYRWYYSGQYLNIKYHSRAIFLSKQECAKAERGRLKEIDEQVRNPGRMKLFDLMQNRLDELQTKKSRDYYKENKRYFRKVIAEWGRDVYTDEITKAMVNQLLQKEAKRLKRAGKSNHKVNSMLRALKALWNYGARIYDLSGQNPCNLEFYPISVTLKYIPPDKHVEAVKKKCSPAQRLLIDFVDESGCRIMEAVRLTFNDIEDGLVTLWTRKSKNSDLTPRRVPIPACIEGLTGKGRVFNNWTAYPRFLEYAVKELKQKAWNWHSLRHRRASLWCAGGISLFEISVRLGHSNPQITRGYLQLLGFSNVK